MNAKAVWEKKRSELYQAGLEFIEQEARKILKAHPNLDEFVMAMGMWTFDYKTPLQYPRGNSWSREIAAMGGGHQTSHGWQWRSCEGVAYITDSPLGKFMDEWDESMHFTGTPMRFTADGPKRTEW